MELYQRFNVSEFCLRDYLALERTILSNERTLLSYLRTGLTLIIAGITGLHFFTDFVAGCLSGLGVIAGISVMTFGVNRFRSIKNRLDVASPGETADVTAKTVSESHPVSGAAE